MAYIVNWGINADGLKLALDAWNDASFASQSFNDLSGNYYDDAVEIYGPVTQSTAAVAESPSGLRYYDFPGKGTGFDHMAVPIEYEANTFPISTMTAICWFNTSFEGASYSDNWSFLDWDRSEYWTFYVRGDTGTVSFSTNCDTAGAQDDMDSVGTGYNDGTWHMAAVVYDGTDKHIYVDGVFDSTNENPHSGNPLGSNLDRWGTIGVNCEAATWAEAQAEADATNKYTGKISMLYYWERILSAAEIWDFFVNTRKRFGV